jgi:hypothetical protein
MNRSELLEDVLALLRDLDKARGSGGAAADFSRRKRVVLERVHRALDKREDFSPPESS